MEPRPVTAGRLWAVCGFSSALLLVTLFVLPLIGSSRIDYGLALAGVSPHKEILFQVRLPRVLLAMLTGGALATAGVLFQALLRESLATPYTLGVSSGASLGAVAVICLGGTSIWAGSIIGAAVTLALVMGVATEARRLSSFTLLMTGVTINSICIAMILFLQNMANFTQSFAMVRWLMGGIEPVEYTTLAWLGAAVAVTVAICFSMAGDWNLISVGEDWAQIRGVATSRVLLIGYLLGSLLTGVVTALTGPIGFVGLIVPHAIRMGLGVDHRTLLPASFLLGAVFLAACDTISRTILSPAEVPAGVVTAMLGGPFFIWMLRRR